MVAVFNSDHVHFSGKIHQRTYSVTRCSVVRLSALVVISNNDGEIAQMLVDSHGEYQHQRSNDIPFDTECYCHWIAISNLTLPSTLPLKQRKDSCSYGQVLSSNYLALGIAEDPFLPQQPLCLQRPGVWIPFYRLVLFKSH